VSCLAGPNALTASCDGIDGGAVAEWALLFFVDCPLRDDGMMECSGFASSVSVTAMRMVRRRLADWLAREKMGHLVVSFVIAVAIFLVVRTYLPPSPVTRALYEHLGNELPTHSP
jgi:hypothetical protein